jgi:hypothetical protein
MRRFIFQGGYFAVALATLGALMGCQSLSYNLRSTSSATMNGDSTLVVGGCEGNIGRGYEVCRFIDGAPMDAENITLIIPYGEDSMAANVRIRAGARLFNVQVNKPVVKIKYTDIFQGSSNFTKQNDGPLQIMVKTLNRDGSFYESLGYLFVIVLSKGYNRDAGEKITKCEVTYTDLGDSEVECDK